MQETHFQGSAACSAALLYHDVQIAQLVSLEFMLFHIHCIYSTSLAGTGREFLLLLLASAASSG